jgi:hypothetical protein
MESCPTISHKIAVNHSYAQNAKMPIYSLSVKANTPTKGVLVLAKSPGLLSSASASSWQVRTHFLLGQSFGANENIPPLAHAESDCVKRLTSLLADLRESQSNGIVSPLSKQHERKSHTHRKMSPKPAETFNVSWAVVSQPLEIIPSPSPSSKQLGPVGFSQIFTMNPYWAHD